MRLTDSGLFFEPPCSYYFVFTFQRSIFLVIRFLNTTYLTAASRSRVRTLH